MDGSKWLWKPPVNDETYIGNNWNATIELKGGFWGFFSGWPSLTGEVVGFAYGRPPTVLPHFWRWGKDVAEISFDPTIRFPVQIYLVNTGGRTIEEARDDAILSVAEANLMWASERAGIVIDLGNDVFKNPVNVTGVGGYSQYNCEGLADIEGDVTNELNNNSGLGVQFNDSIINVYYFGSVVKENGSMGPNVGRRCTSPNARRNIISMGASTDGMLLAHEFGHAFGLDHVGDPTDTDFNDENIMYENGGARKYLTEGQTFRQVWGGASAQNTLYQDLSPEGQPRQTRPCFQFRRYQVVGGPIIPGVDQDIDGETKYKCPYEEKRIWADGGFPPN